MAIISVVVLALGVVLGRMVLDGSQPPAGQPEPVGEAAPTPTATPTPTAPAPTATPTRSATRSASGSAPTLTATATPAAPVARTPGPTVAPDLALEITSLKPNQYLGYVAQRYGVSLEEVVELSGIENPDVVPIGQGLIIPHRPGRNTPDQVLLPDSELVYGPAYVDFDINAFVDQQGGRLAQISMTGANGEQWSGADVVERVAMRYSVGPRVLLAMMEAGSGWVTDPNPTGLAADYPLGHTNGAPGLLPQLEWAADALNHGFYGWQDRGETAIRFEDGTLARGAPGLNPGTVAVQRALAADASYSQLPDRLAEFDAAYRRLFGDPAALDAGPVLPAGLEQPALHLPWLPGEWWHLTGGPHGGWMPSSGWAALDFVPETAQIGNCVPAAVVGCGRRAWRGGAQHAGRDPAGPGRRRRHAHRLGAAIPAYHRYAGAGRGVGPGRSRGPAQLRGRRGRDHPSAFRVALQRPLGRRRRSRSHGFGWLDSLWWVRVRRGHGPARPAGARGDSLA
ncbi:MAG: LysM domain-containing protein [Anaerolineae bacterium]